MPKPEIVPIEQVERAIVVLRGYRVTPEEALRSRSQIAILKGETLEITNISKPGRGGLGRGKNLKYAPLVFTEQGIAMLSSVLRSPRAVQVNIEIMRAFVRLRQWLRGNAELAQKLEALEEKYDGQFKAVFDAIRALTAPPASPKKRIGFETDGS